MGNLSGYVKMLAHSAYFKGIIMGAILLNTVTFAISSSLEPTDKTIIYINILDGVDSCFLALYSLEFVIKLYSYGRCYWFNGFNCFDFGVLLCSLLQLVLSQTEAKNLGVIKVMRSLRALRPLRSISLIGGLQVVVTALIATFTGSFIHIILLLCLLMFVYGIMAFYVYGYDTATDTSNEFWGSFGKSYLSLFILITAEGWTDVMKSLKNGGENFGIYFFIISFLFVGHFIFGNLFVAVVIEQIDRATAGYQKRIETKKATVIYNKKKKAKVVQESEIKHIINQMKSGDFKCFPRVVLDMYKHVRKDEFNIKQDAKCVPLWVESFVQEYTKLGVHYKMIRDYHFEIVHCLGKLLSDMDQSVQVMITEKQAAEQAVFRHNFRSASFLGGLRRLSQRMSIFSTNKGGKNLLGETIGVEIVDSQEGIKGSCLSCFGFVNDCRCTNPEIEARDLEEEREGRTGRLYSTNTTKWLGEPLQGPRLSTSSKSSAKSSYERND